MMDSICESLYQRIYLQIEGSENSDEEVQYSRLSNHEHPCLIPKSDGCGLWLSCLQNLQLNACWPEISPTVSRVQLIEYT